MVMGQRVEQSSNSLAGPSRGMLLVASQRDHVEKQYGVQLRPIQRCGDGPALLGSALVAATRCLFTAGSAWKGKEGSPAQGAALGFLCRKTVQH